MAGRLWLLHGVVGVVYGNGRIDGDTPYRDYILIASLYLYIKSPKLVLLEQESINKKYGRMKKVFFSKLWLVCIVTILFCGNTLAQSISDAPKEGSLFYTEDGYMKTAKKVSRKAPSSNWDITSTVENCFDEGNIGEYAWLMTADGETKLSVTLTYSGDDSRYTIASQEVKFYFYEGNDLFHDENKELITETERFVGTYTTENTEKTAIVRITAPSYYEYTTNAYYTYYVVIKVKFKNGGSASVAKNIGVSRPGVIILHGLGDSSATFQPLKKYLVNSGQFISSQILTKDYSATHTSSFYANTHQKQVVRDGLFELSDSLFAVGIASTKYDMVGHSMGGILERLYTQEIDNKHTNKIITLNTPHYGSVLNKYLSQGIEWFCEYYTFLNEDNPNPYYRELLLKIPVVNSFLMGDNSKRAIYDLAPNSEEILKMNSPSYVNRLYGIPVYAVGSAFKSSQEIIYEDEYDISDDDDLVQLNYLYGHLIKNDIPTNPYYYLNDDDTDGIVSVYSQKGGLEDFNSIFYGSWNAVHINSPKWEKTQNEIRLLLLSPPDGYNFCMTGFKPLTLTSRMKVAENSNYSTEYIDGFAEPLPASYINVKAESILFDNYNCQISLSHSNDMSTIVVYASLSTGKMISAYDKDTLFFCIEDLDDEVTFYSIGRTNYNALVIDSVKVNWGQANGIKELRQTSSSLKYYVDGNKLKIGNVSAQYRLSIYDITGRVLAEMNSNPSHIYTLPTNNGFLIISVRTKEGTQTFKIRTFPN